MAQTGSMTIRLALMITLTAACLVGVISAAQSVGQPTSAQPADDQFGVLEEIDVRGLSEERAAALIAGLPAKRGEPLSKSQCERVGDYVRSFDKQLRVAFVREDGSQSRAAIIIYPAS